MQVNKRNTAAGNFAQPPAKKSRTKSNDSDVRAVEEAALKYQESTEKEIKPNVDQQDENSNESSYNSEHDANIDSELLTQQAQSYAESQSADSNNYLQAQQNEHAEQHPVQQILHQSTEKPLAGTEEWHRIRKDNHKEVERRRRENINAGIKDLAELLPSPETNKSQILQRAIEYIRRLKENENNNNEKWTLEKLLNDQNNSELTATNEKLKAELERAYREVEHWKKVSSITKDDKR